MTIELSNMRKQIEVPPNVIKVHLDMLLVLLNVTIEPSNVRKKKLRKPSNMIKVQSHVMLVSSDVTMELSNVRKN